MSLDGERAEDYAWIGAEMEKGMPEGMQKLAEAIRRAAGEQA